MAGERGPVLCLCVAGLAKVNQCHKQLAEFRDFACVQMQETSETVQNTDRWQNEQRACCPDQIAADSIDDTARREVVAKLAAVHVINLEGMVEPVHNEIPVEKAECDRVTYGPGINLVERAKSQSSSPISQVGDGR
jgi:hypothetical protein